MKITTLDTHGAFTELLPGVWTAGVSPQTRLGRGYLIANAIRVHADRGKYDYASSEVEFDTPRAAESHARWMAEELNLTIRNSITA